MADQLTFDDDGGNGVFKAAWKRVMEGMKEQVPETIYLKFLEPLAPHSFEEDVAVVLCPGRFIHEWNRSKYHALLQERLSKEIGHPVKLDLVVQAREKPLITQQTATVTTVPAISDRPIFKPNPKYTFENFVVGRSNQLALAGAKAILDSVGCKYNPLFIYGSSGLGKTHLMHAVANRLLEQDPIFPIRYITAQQFTEDFVNALQSNRVEQFRRLQRNVQVWLVDDIQLILGKDRTQEEIFHTFNYLHSIGKQIVLCSDRTPRDLVPMDERLRSRFESGLVADVQMPDTETRCAILQTKAKQENVQINMEIAMYLAENVPGNVRNLEGALTKVAAIASLTGGQVSLDLTKQMVEDYYHGDVHHKPSFKQILEAVSKRTHIDVREITGSSRKAPVANARHIAIYMTREILRDSWKHIGELFGNRDHTSMMHGYNKIRTLISVDREFGSLVNNIMQDIYPNH